MKTVIEWYKPTDLLPIMENEERTISTEVLIMFEDGMITIGTYNYEYEQWLDSRICPDCSFGNEIDEPIQYWAYLNFKSI